MEIRYALFDAAVQGKQLTFTATEYAEDQTKGAQRDFAVTIHTIRLATSPHLFKVVDSISGHSFSIEILFDKSSSDGDEDSDKNSDKDSVFFNIIT